MRSAAAGLILAAVTASASPDVPTASASQSEAQTVSEVAAVSGATFNLSEVRAMHFREDTGIEGVSRLEASTTIGPDDFVFAVEETDRNESYIRMLASLAEGLRVAFPDRRTHIRQIPSRGFIDVVRAEKIPFVFATAGTMGRLSMNLAQCRSPHGNDSIPMQKNPRRVLPADCLSLTPSAGIWAVWRASKAHV